MPSVVRGLRRVDLGREPGYARHRRGHGFSYVDQRGRVISDRARRERIRRLAIPPAWTDVWICADADGHVQATGRDARGRLQYRYHQRWTEARGRMKFGQLAEFCRALPALRRRVRRDLGCPCLCRKNVLAAVVALLDKGHLRVGNDEYARANGSFGATTLEPRHVRVHGERVELRYRGKSGVRREVEVSDPVVAAVLRRCLAVGANKVFCYRDGARVRRITSADVNAYVRAGAYDGGSKTFRTWAATVRCLAELASATDPGDSLTARRRTVAAVIKSVAERLGHTPAVCRKSYVHPRVIELFLSDRLPPLRAGAAERFMGRVLQNR